MPGPKPRSLFEKIWDQHAVKTDADGSALLYIDRHYLQDGSPRKFEIIAARGLKVRRPDLTFAAHDHYAPSISNRFEDVADPAGLALLRGLERHTGEHGIRLFGLGDSRQGIIHVVGPEQGISLPGATITSSDSHTTTHGGIGAFAFGIGASEGSHIFATQCLWVARPRSMRIQVDGLLARGVTAKDVALAILARIGAGGARGYAVEYAGRAIRGLTVEGRLTLCNMAIESGARAGMVAADDTVFDWLHGRPYAPKGAAWDRALAHWRALPTEEGAPFDHDMTLDGAAIAPMVTWGISPEHAMPVTGRVPDPASAADEAQRAGWQRALDYMDLKPGTTLAGLKIDRVFIGSCTNARIEDLRLAAAMIQGRKVAVPSWVVPGSVPVRQQAEAEGLDRLFTAAGFEWRHPGCSMCVSQNGDHVPPGERCVSTTNRNFIGRQGPGARTHLASPAMAAAAALTGCITDIRSFGA
jgi:3-isopropylmalate/(R)-2-methylmalate dehydratase large subunit